MKKSILIDGNSLINRAFYSMTVLTNRDGVYTNAVYGFTNMLIKVITDESPNEIVVAFDVKAPTFRHEMYSEYKAGRKAMPEELRPQLQTLKDLLHKMDIKTVEKAGIEADDILGTLSKRFVGKVIVLTGDRDALQLVDKNVEVWLTKKGLSEILKVTPENIQDNFGVTAEHIVDLKALMGDSSDNIPGVAGIGEVTAKKLLGDYADLDGVYNNIDDIKGKVKEKLELNKDNAYLSYKLATIETNADFDCVQDECGYTFPFSTSVYGEFEYLQFSSLLKRDNLFSKESTVAKYEIQTIEIKDDLSLLDGRYDMVSIYVDSDIYVSFNDEIENKICIKNDLLSEGFSPEDVSAIVGKILACTKEVVVFDLKGMLHAYKFDMSNKIYHDVALMAYIVGHSGINSLKALIEKYNLSTEHFATSLIKLNAVLSEQVEEFNLQELYELELNVCKTLYELEVYGCKIDTRIMEELSREYNEKLSILTAQIREIAGNSTLNINSPKQLGVLLFEELKLKSGKKTKTGYSTDNEVLEALEGEHEIVTPIIEYRQLSKLNGTYIDGFRNILQSGGRLHTEYKQFLTATGRLSSVEPNLQNIPALGMGREIRKMFVSSFDDGYLVSADYSQIELRLLAHFSGDGRLVDAYRNNEDIHAYTASLMFGVDITMVTPTMRKQAKAINFGIIYGKSDFSLAKELHISRKQGKEFIDKYFASYPKVKPYLDGIVETARELGYTSTLLGRIRKMPELKASNYNVRSHAERAAMNMPLQGSAADIIKVAMERVQRALKASGLKSKLMLQVHDELIVDTCHDEVEVVKDILITNMQDAVKLSVPLTVEAEVGRNWFEI